MVSIIVPVYNVEVYLRKCIDSILAQTFTNFECILIDDASPDNCPVICDEYAAKDNRIKVIHKIKNEGLPKARKTGIDIAKAEFIIHVDSDDWISENAIDALLKKQKESNADIVIGGYKTIFPRREEIYEPSSIKKYDSPLNASFYEYQMRYLVGKLYRKSCFNDYEVPEFNVGEDAIVNIQIFTHCEYKNIAVISDIVYYYNRITNTNLTALKKIVCNNCYEYPRIKFRLWIKNYLTEHNLFSDVEHSFTFDFLQIGVFKFLRFSKKINKKDIEYLYNEYYLPFTEKRKLSFFCKTLIIIYKKCFFLGCIYSSIQNLLSNIRNGK
ncbi:MAG: glycosyltransferase [Treponema sp.]|jgi:glycosyltransferase involved in cell wall biosynthesis|nr:glycosyltransferase [Treponema sp.]